MIANLNTRLNAVKTLESRLHLIETYLSNLSTNRETAPATSPQPSHTLLRNIYSLVSHLSLLNPHDTALFASESLAQANDVTIVKLLGSLGQSTQAMRELGKKFSVVDSRREQGIPQTRRDDPMYLLKRGNSSGPALWDAWCESCIPFFLFFFLCCYTVCSTWAEISMRWCLTRGLGFSCLGLPCF